MISSLSSLVIQSIGMEDKITLQDIIKKAYLVFKKYKISQPLNICNCCVSTKQERELLTLKTDDIPVHTMASYLNSAKRNNKITSQEEIKHFLPRIIDLIVNNNLLDLVISEEIIFRILDHMIINEWNAKELDILEKFSKAFFIQKINKYPETFTGLGNEIDTTIIMLEKTKISLKKLLDIWLYTDNFSSTMHYKDLLVYYIKYQNLENSFGIENTNLGKIVYQWATHTKTKEIFTKRFRSISFDKVDEFQRHEIDLLLIAFENNEPFELIYDIVYS